jgi:hypothetical protein
VTFVGEERAGDDYGVNILPRETLNLLYHVLDVCLIPSRWEGGPHAVLEAALAGCGILSSRVGIARDILPEACLFDSCDDAVAKLRVYARGEGGAGMTEAVVRETVLAGWSLPAVRSGLESAFSRFRAGPLCFREWAFAGRAGGHRERIEALQRTVVAEAGGVVPWLGEPTVGDVVSCARAILGARRGL